MTKFLTFLSDQQNQVQLCPQISCAPSFLVVRSQPNLAIVDKSYSSYTANEPPPPFSCNGNSKSSPNPRPTLLCFLHQRTLLHALASTCPAPSGCREPVSPCTAFLAAVSCSAFASLSRRCSSVSPSSRCFTAGFRACALCLPTPPRRRCATLLLGCVCVVAQEAHVPICLHMYRVSN